jgi:hypothetical protein
MAPPWMPLRETQSRIRLLRALLVVAVLIATTSIAPVIVQCLLVTIGMTCAVVAIYWECWRLSIGSLALPDICVRCGRGIIARVAVSRGGDR